MENPNKIDPLLKPGAFIDPNPVSNGNGKPKGEKVNPRQSSVEVTDEANRPDWLPPGWRFKEFLRTSSASAGTRDKYFIDPATNRRFRSKKEVFRYLETGITPQKRKAGDSDADNMSGPNSATPKQTKTEPPKPKFSIENFKFDDVPEKVKWQLTDVYNATWMPKIDDANPVLESTKEEWTSAFTYLSLKNGGAMF